MKNNVNVKGRLLNALGRPAMRDVIDKAGVLGVQYVNSRVESGKFLSGDLQNKGYSIRPLPTFYIGKITDFNRRSVTFRNPALGRTVKVGKNSLIWYTEGQGTGAKRKSLLRGGYKHLRDLTGRESNVVQLNWSGAMLNSLKSHVEPDGNFYKAVIRVSPENREKAFYTNKRREWLNFTNHEKEKLRQYMISLLNSYIEGM